MATATLTSEGIIEPDRLYTLDAFKTATGMKAASLRHARRQGLVLRRVGIRTFVLGADFIDFVRQHGKPVA